MATVSYLLPLNKGAFVGVKLDAKLVDAAKRLDCTAMKAIVDSNSYTIEQRNQVYTLCMVITGIQSVIDNVSKKNKYTYLLRYHITQSGVQSLQLKASTSGCSVVKSINTTSAADFRKSIPAINAMLERRVEKRGNKPVKQSASSKRIEELENEKAELLVRIAKLEAASAGLNA